MSVQVPSTSRYLGGGFPQHQSYQHQHPSQILEALAASPPTKRKRFVYVTIHLRRTSYIKPWGISFSSFDGNIILGDVKQTLVKCCTAWSYVVLAKDRVLDSRKIFLPLSAPGEVSEMYRYADQLRHYAYFMASDLDCRKHEKLLPGDLIIAIDGHRPSSFLSLSQVTDYLRKSLHVSLVVLRQPQVTTSALAFWDPKLVKVPPTDSPFKAAAAANILWKTVLSDLARAPVPPVVRRQVTIDESPQQLLIGQTTCNPYTVARPPPAAHHSNYPFPSVSQRPLPENLTEKFENPLFLLSQVAAARCVPMQLSILPRHSYPRHIPQTYSTTARDLSKKAGNSMVRKLGLPTKSSHVVPEKWRNPWFKQDGRSLPYDDNWEFSPEEGSRAELFLPPVGEFQLWLLRRKEGWRSRYTVYKYTCEDEDENENDKVELETSACSGSRDFWTKNEFSSFDEWLSQSRSKWKLSYSWNKRKRKRIRQECEQIVHLSQPKADEFQHWLRIRRNQWRLLRRKRQRQREERGGGGGGEAEQQDIVSNLACYSGENLIIAPQFHGTTPEKALRHHHLPLAFKRRKLLSPAPNDMTFIDDILEEEDRHRQTLKDRPPVDISFLFEATKGAPDDVVVHCLEYLDRREHGKLLCISRATAESLKARDSLWRQLCPSHWILPRRPRKPWHELYITRLRNEQRDSQKRWDDLVLNCASVLAKGDHLQKLEKIVLRGESEISFRVDYLSPVVCERNSLLNLAVIKQRHKVVRWLVDQKGADIESYDRGQFTPLLNAAWSGDRHLVRFFLQRGSDRSKIGTGHYSQALAAPDFKGLTAEGWARKKGHNEIADLIRLGL